MCGSPIKGRRRIAQAETVRQLIDDAGIVGIDADVQRILSAELRAPEGVDIQDVIACPFCYDDAELAAIEFDVQTIVDRFRVEIDETRAHLSEMFEGNRYLTRLYSTMSAAEMDLDPEFEFNPDLGAVPSRRTAVQRVSCINEQPDFGGAIIETPSGIRFRLVDGLNPHIIRRQGGETTRGMDVPGAQIIERTFAIGQSEIEQDRTDDINAAGDVDGTGDAAGCACDAVDGSAPGALALLLALLFGVPARRRR